ncbi:MAG: hypothetical protein EA385_05550 [Salinarimonadaceae bacterium]|nr:MAG: hypothetical protein EA385_05550 [Salinarimonadaceae bacterium]
MIFALGFFISTLLALLILPALAERADRLARRRVESQLPVSVSEFNAERDRLRAELAVRERRMEIRLEKTLAKNAALLAELGARANRIDDLKSELDAALARGVELEAELSETRATLEATQGERDAARGERDATRAELVQTREDLAAREAAYADLDARHQRELSDAAARRIRISDLETRLETELSKVREAERLLAERAKAADALENEIERLRKALSDEEARGVALERRVELIMQERESAETRIENLDLALSEMSRVRETLLDEIDRRENLAASAKTRAEALEASIESAREAQTTLEAENRKRLKGLKVEIDQLKTEKASLRSELSQARAERKRLKRDLDKAVKGAEAARSRARRETSTVDLLSRIDKVTDMIMASGRSAAPADPASGTDRTAGVKAETKKSKGAGKRKTQGPSPEASPQPAADRASKANTPL